MKKLLLIDPECIISANGKNEKKLRSPSFKPKAISTLGKIAGETEYVFALSENSTKYAPNVLSLLNNIMTSEGIVLENVNSAGELKKSFRTKNYDLQNSFIIHEENNHLVSKKFEGKIILIGSEKSGKKNSANVVFKTTGWDGVYRYLKGGLREVKLQRKTRETNISVTLNLDGQGTSEISTGLNFFDHMLEQIARHGNIDLQIQVKGDLHVDEHHTIEDTAIALGEAFAKALGDKRGIERYGFCLPMDDALAQVAIDFGGRNWLVWQADFKREKIGEVPTEMFFHFFKSFSDAAKCNLNIKVEGNNEHHKIEAVFKAFAKAIKMAVKRDLSNMQLPSTKDIL